MNKHGPDQPDPKEIKMSTLDIVCDIMNKRKAPTPARMAAEKIFEYMEESFPDLDIEEFIRVPEELIFVIALNLGIEVKK